MHLTTLLLSILLLLLVFYFCVIGPLVSVLDLDRRLLGVLVRAIGIQTPLPQTRRTRWSRIWTIIFFEGFGFAIFIRGTLYLFTNINSATQRLCEILATGSLALSIISGIVMYLLEHRRGRSEN